MFLPSVNTKVYLALGSTDMRKSINGLSIMVSEQMQLDPFTGHLFAFCNKNRNMLKILYWDRNGFCLWHKKLEKHSFKWPSSKKEVIDIENKPVNSYKFSFKLIACFNFRSATFFKNSSLIFSLTNVHWVISVKERKHPIHISSLSRQQFLMQGDSTIAISMFIHTESQIEYSV